MRVNFGIWYLLTIVLGPFSETLSKSLETSKKNGTSSADLMSAKWVSFQSSHNTMTTMLKKITFEHKNLTWFTLNRKSDNQKILQVEEPQQDKEKLTNVTVVRNIKKDDKFQSRLSLIGDYVFGSLLLISYILAILGNGFALLIFRFRQQRLIPIEVFFINLAIPNLLLSVTSYPLSTISSFKHGWNFEETGCTIYGFWCYFLGLSSIYTITAMAFTRYLITCKPVQGNRISRWTCCQMIAIGYLLAFVLAVIPLLGFGNYEVEPFGLSCSLDWIAKDIATRIYMILVTVFCVLLPLITLVFCYYQIIITVRQSNLLMANAGVNKRNMKESNRQLTWISALISTGFVIAWFPYTIACLWTSFQGEVVLPIWLTPCPSLFAKFAIVYNPIIHIFLTPRYRQDVYDLVQYISSKFNPSKNERKQNNSNIATAAERNGSNTCHGEPSIYLNRTDKGTVEISQSCGLLSMKQTYV